MHGQFDSPITLPSNGSPPFRISGPLEEVDSGVDEVRIIFLIVQGQGGKVVTVQGEGTWKRSSSGNKWIGEAVPPVTPYGGAQPKFDAGPARGIALAIAISKGQVVNGDFVPPSIETLTWCADFKFET
jgi:hypothetical protein